MAADPKSPLVVAHRGAPREAHENSPAAFEAAIRQGADMVELDVRRTLDGALVVHHNAAVRGVPVSMLTHRELLRRCRREPPLLETVVELCAGRTGLDVEIKQTGCEAAVLDTVTRRFGRDRLLLTSFEEKVIGTLTRLDPALRCGLLLGPARMRARAQRYGALPFALAERCGASLLVLHQVLAPLRAPRARPSLLDEAARRGVPILVWTVNSPLRMRAYLSDSRVAGIITDLPGVAVETRRALAGPRSGPPDEAVPQPVTDPTRRPFPRRMRPDIHR